MAVMAVIVVGCGTAPTKPVTTEQVMIGSLKLTYNSNGEMVKMVATGVAPLAGRSAHSLSEASKIAQLRAKQTIVEFLKNDVKVNTDMMSQSLSNATSNSENINNDNIEIVTKVAETIKSNSQAVLRGLMLTNQTVANDSVIVEMTVSPQSVDAATAARNMFGR